MKITTAKTLLIYLLTVPIFFLIDMIWLGVVAKDFYKRHLGYLMRPQVNWGAAISFYLLFIIGSSYLPSNRRSRCKVPVARCFMERCSGSSPMPRTT